MLPKKDLILIKPVAQDVGQFKGIADEVIQVNFIRSKVLGIGFAGPTLVEL